VESRPAGCCGLNTVEPEISEIERINKGVDRANRIALVDPIVQALRQKRRLASIGSLDEPLHDHPRRIIRGIIVAPVFSHSQVQNFPSRRLLG
jgi:hypothetical protein